MSEMAPRRPPTVVKMISKQLNAARAGRALSGGHADVPQWCAQCRHVFYAWPPHCACVVFKAANCCARRP